MVKSNYTNNAIRSRIVVVYSENSITRTYNVKFDHFYMVVSGPELLKMINDKIKYGTFDESAIIRRNIQRYKVRRLLPDRYFRLLSYRLLHHRRSRNTSLISSFVKSLRHYRPWWVTIFEAVMVQVVEYKSTSHDKPFVAIVNDAPEVAYSMRDVLSQNVGAKVLAFTDPRKALEHFNLNYREYAVLISDCIMPGMNGLDFLEKAKETCPSVVTIYTCGCDLLIEDLLRKYCDFVDEFLPAPIARPDLIREVKECIRVSKINKNSVKGMSN